MSGPGVGDPIDPAEIPETPASAEPVDAVAPGPVEPVLPESEPVEAVAAEPEPESVVAEPDVVVPEPEPAVAAPEPEPVEAVAVEPDAVPEPGEPVAAEPDAVPEPADAPEPVAAEPDAVPEPAEPADAPEPVAAEPDAVPEPADAPEPDAAETESAEPVAPEPVAGAEPAAAGPVPPPLTGPIAHPPIPKPKPVTETGRILEGVVTAVSSDFVELTLDDGRPAVINRRNFGLDDEDPSTVLSVGDRVFGAELAREDPKSRVVLSRAWALKRQAWEKVVKAAEKNETMTGKVVSTSKKGLVVDVGVRGFVPSSHLELGTTPDVASYADQSLELRVLEVDPRREKLVLSRRSLLLKAQRKEAQELLGTLKAGEVRSGTVASLTEYGAFVDLGGISGLVHISELSWHRVGKPADVVSVGDKVEVKILDVKPKKKRISLSLRQTAPDPLLELDIGSVVTGRVTRLVDFGAFVAVGTVEGLVHLSELAEYRVGSPEEVVAPGDEVGVKILSVDTRRRRVELSIRRAAEFSG